MDCEGLLAVLLSAIFVEARMEKVLCPIATFPRSQPVLEVKLNPELQCSRTMRIHGMKEGTSCQAIHSVAHKTRRVVWPTVAPDGVVQIAAVRIIDAKLRVIECVERFQAELKGSRFTQSKRF